MNFSRSITIALSLVAFGPDAFACSCVQSLGDYWISEILSGDNMIAFSGTPISSGPDPLSLEFRRELESAPSEDQKREIRQRYREKGIDGYYWRTKFLVEDSFGGSLPHFVNVRYHSDGAACGYYFELFDPQFVIASQRNGVLYTGQCYNYNIPEGAAKQYLETKEDIFVPDYISCELDLFNAFNSDENYEFTEHPNPACAVHDDRLQHAIESLKEIFDR